MRPTPATGARSAPSTPSSATPPGRARTRSGSEQLAAAEAQLAAAPDDVKEDFEKVVEFVRYRTENAADAAGIEERLAEVMEPLGRAVAIIQRECGFNPFQF